MAACWALVRLLAEIKSMAYIFSALSLDAESTDHEWMFKLSGLGSRKPRETTVTKHRRSVQVDGNNGRDIEKMELLQTLITG